MTRIPVWIILFSHTFSYVLSNTFSGFEIYSVWLQNKICYIFREISHKLTINIYIWIWSFILRSGFSILCALLVLWCFLSVRHKYKRLFLKNYNRYCEETFGICWIYRDFIFKNVGQLKMKLCLPSSFFYRLKSLKFNIFIYDAIFIFICKANKLSLFFFGMLKFNLKKISPPLSKNSNYLSIV